jgi:hypothetical protein
MGGLEEWEREDGPRRGVGRRERSNACWRKEAGCGWYEKGGARTDGRDDGVGDRVEGGKREGQFSHFIFLIHFQRQRKPFCKTFSNQRRKS